MLRSWDVCLRNFFRRWRPLKVGDRDVAHPLCTGWGARLRRDLEMRGAEPVERGWRSQRGDPEPGTCNGLGCGEPRDRAEMLIYQPSGARAGLTDPALPVGLATTAQLLHCSPVACSASSQGVVKSRGRLSLGCTAPASPSACSSLLFQRLLESVLNMSGTAQHTGARPA